MTGEKLVPNGSASKLVFGSPQLPIGTQVRGQTDTKNHSLLAAVPAPPHVIIQGNTQGVMIARREPDREPEVHRDLRIIASEKQIEKVSLIVDITDQYIFAITTQHICPTFPEHAKKYLF